MRGRLLVAACLLISCGRNSGVRVRLAEPFPARLSEWRLFTGELARLEPNQGVVSYDVVTPLFSDYAAKSRTVWLPPGTQARYHETEAFDFPVGTILSKSFYYRRERLIETRLLVRARTGWVGLPYVWNEAQTDATLEIAADPVKVDWTHPSGQQHHIDYMIPNTNQCKGCHENAGVMSPLGLKARHLNRANQLEHWTRIGYLTGVPAQVPSLAAWDDPRSGSIAERARAYLDINCANCHNPSGPANTSGLYLGVSETDPLRLGVCKTPVAAGQGAGDLQFSIVPGRPDQSILVRRMESTEPKIVMPELGRTLVHKEAVALIRAWIASLAGSCGG